MSALEAQRTRMKEPPSQQMGLRIIVGGSTPQSVMDRFATAVPNGADIAVLTVATKYGDKTFKECEDAIRRSSFREAIHHISRETTPKDARRKLRTSGGIYISGGDQAFALLYMRHMEIDSEIPAMSRQGAITAVNSAGTALAGEQAIVPTELVETDEEEVPVEIVPGLSIVDGVLFDPHFSERERIKRLGPFVEDTGLLGIGIDGATAALIDANGKVEVAGRKSGTVTVLIPSNGRSYEPIPFRRGETFELSDYMPLIKPHAVFDATMVT